MITIPTVLFISSLQMSLGTYIRELSNKVAEMQKYVVGAQRLYDFLDAPEEEPRVKKQSRIIIMRMRLNGRIFRFNIRRQRSRCSIIFLFLSGMGKRLVLPEEAEAASHL